MLNPVWLETFITLVDTGNFTRTAEQRFMTQPGVSQHVKKLEQACDSKLVVRLGKRIQLTAQGRQVYDYAKAQKAQQEHFVANLKFDAPDEGKCVIGCSGAIAQRIYPELLRLQGNYPGLRIHLEVAPRTSVMAGIVNNAIDLGIVTNKPSNEDIACTYLGEEPLGLILPRVVRHSENAIDKVLTSLGLIAHPDALHYLQRYINDCGEPLLNNLNPANIKQTGYVNQLSQILQPVSKGLGFTVLPLSTLRFVNFADELRVFQSKKTVTEPLYSIQTPHSALPARFARVKATIAKALSTS